MPCQIIVLIGNDNYNDQKYSGLIVLGDYVEKGSVWSHKTSKSSKNWGSKAQSWWIKTIVNGAAVTGSVLETPLVHIRVFCFMCVAKYLRCCAGGAKYGTWWAAVTSIYDYFVPIFILQVNEMASTQRSCRNKPGVFCYIYGEYAIDPKRKPIKSFITRAYLAYFVIKLADQDRVWAPHLVCKTFIETAWVDQWQ